MYTTADCVQLVRFYWIKLRFTICFHNQWVAKIPSPLQKQHIWSNNHNSELHGNRELVKTICHQKPFTLHSSSAWRLSLFIVDVKSCKAKCIPSDTIKIHGKLLHKNTMEGNALVSLLYILENKARNLEMWQLCFLFIIFDKTAAQLL